MRRGPDGSAIGGWRLSPLTIYSFYRVLLAAAIAFLFIANLDSTTRLGSYRPGSHDLADMEGCLVDHPDIVACLTEIRRRGEELGVVRFSA